MSRIVYNENWKPSPEMTANGRMSTVHMAAHHFTTICFWAAVG